MKLLNDNPLGELANLRKDGLDFEVYSKVLCKTAINTTGPFSIGIFGDWGSGKTSLMKLVEKGLGDEKKIITVWFNAWKFENESHPIIPMISKIITSIEENQSFINDLKDKGVKFLQTLKAIIYGFSISAKIKIPELVELDGKFDFDKIIQRLDNNKIDNFIIQSTYFNAFKILDEVSRNLDYKIVVFVDDLDRCFPDNAIKLLESIKLVLDQPNFIFFVGVSRKIIEGYLDFRYLNQFGIKDFKGGIYLDKIIQLGFYLPSSKGKNQTFLSEVVKDLEKDDQDLLLPILSVVSPALNYNPRSIIRFINLTLVDKNINDVLHQSSGGASIPLHFFAISRVLQLLWDNVFSLLMHDINLSVVLGEVLSSAKNIHEISLKEYNLSEYETEFLESIISSIKSDKNLENLLVSNYGINWLKDAGNRAASFSFAGLTSNNVQNDKIDVYILPGNDKQLVDLSIKLNQHVAFWRRAGKIRFYLDTEDTKQQGKLLRQIGLLKESKFIILFLNKDSIADKKLISTLQIVKGEIGDKTLCIFVDEDSFSANLQEMGISLMFKPWKLMLELNNGDEQYVDKQLTDIAIWIKNRIDSIN